MKISIKVILSFCLATFLPLYSQFYLATYDNIPVSIPCNVKSIEDCFIGIPVSNNSVTWVPLNAAMERFYGGSGGTYTYGNAYLSISSYDSSWERRLEQQRFQNYINSIIDTIHDTEKKDQNRLQVERVAVIAQQRAQEEETRQSEIADFKIELLHQENFAHKKLAQDLYLTWSDSELTSRFHARAAALKNIFQMTNSLLTKKSYTVLKPVQTIIAQYDKQADYATLQGSELQHVLHQELLDLYEQSAQLPSSAAFYKEQIAQTGALVREANENGSVLLASQILDYGWTLLECGKSVALGVKDGVVNVASAAIHPIDTLTDMAHGVLQVAQLSLAGIKEAGCFAYDAAVNKEQMYARLDNYCNTTQQFCDGISQIPTQELIRKTTAFLTEAVILHRAFKALPQVKQLAKQSSHNAVNYIQKTRQAIEQSRTAAVTAEGMQLPAKQYLEQMAIQIERTGQKISKVKLEKGLVELHKKFEPIFGEELPFKVYKHVFEGEAILNNEGKLTKISGWHYDYLGKREKIKRIQGIPFEIADKGENINNFYKLYVKGATDKPFPKSFFPKTWAPEDVMKRVEEAYFWINNKNIAFEIDSRTGNLVAQGLTKEKNIIKFIKSGLSGKIISFYPVL